MCAAIDRLSQRPAPTFIDANDIKRNIAKNDPRHVFPKNDNALRIIRRILDRLERDGLVRSLHCGKRGVRCVYLQENAYKQGWCRSQAAWCPLHKREL